MAISPPIALTRTAGEADAEVLNRLSDEELVQQTRRGNRDAFAVLVERHQDGVVNLVYRLVWNWEEALDIAQETFVRAYEALSTFQPERRFKPWLYRIAANISYDYLRRQQRLEAFGPDGHLSVKANATSADPHMLVEQREIRQTVEEVIAELPPRYRAVVVLRYFEELSYTEIAEVLDMPVGTVKTYLHRARTLLRVALRRRGMTP